MGRVAPGAWRLAAVPLALAPVAGVLSGGVAAVALAVVAGFVLWFHRDPDRDTPPAGVVAPADGTVSVLRTESGDANSTEKERVRLGIFMNVTDVHVNRAPLGGEVEAVEYEPGAHRPAFTKSSDRNEKLHVRFADHDVTLVAGAFARRIHPYVEPGDTLARGERLGHVSFGSRADVLFPPNVSLADVTVETGETVRAGQTVLLDRDAD